MTLPIPVPPTGPCLELLILDKITRNPLEGATVSLNFNDVESELVTDASGVVLVRFPQEHVSPLLMISVQKAGYVDRTMSWNPDAPDFQIPANFTLELDTVQCIGGVVQNEEGLPIEGTKVKVRTNSTLEFQGSVLVGNSAPTGRVVTDKDGRWQWDEAPPDLRLFQIGLSHREYISGPISPLPPAEEFLQKRAILIQKRGVPWEGTVTNEAGDPVADAYVYYGHSIEWWWVPSARTDASGRFRFGALPRLNPLGHIFTITSDDYAPELVEFAADAPSSPLRIILGKGHPLRLRVVDPQGNPVLKVRISACAWRNHSSLRFEPWETDGDGIAVWKHAPADPIGYAFTHPGFGFLWHDLQPDQATQTIILPPKPVYT